LRTIFHIAPKRDWDAAQRRGIYDRSSRDLTLEEQGFVHCAEAHQVASVADLIYGDVDEPLVVLAIDVDALDVEVRHENLEGGAESFTHVYGPIPVHAVTSVTPLLRDVAGRFRFVREDR
jgi:uncharacterized protein (DUF952 family)